MGGRSALVALAGLLLVLAAAAPARGASLEAEISFADPSIVGTSDVVGTVHITGSDFGGEPIEITGIEIEPSCAHHECFAAEAGVFDLGTQATGAIGTACEGLPFGLQPPAGPTFAVDFTWTTPAFLDAGRPSCSINFVYSTLKVPATDPDVLPGVQAYQRVKVNGDAGIGFPVAFDLGEVTVLPAPPKGVPLPVDPVDPPAPAKKKRKCKKKTKAGKKRKCKRKRP